MPNRKREIQNVGIDVGKTTLDVVIHERGSISLPPMIQRVRYIIGCLALATRFNESLSRPPGVGNAFFVMAAAEKGLPVVISQPIKVRRYAGAAES